MNAAHLHLIVNHLPIFTTLIGIVILAWGMIRKSDAIRNIAFVLFIIGAAGSYVALETGESAEDIVEEIATVSHDVIHDHEEAAELSMWFAVLMGFLSVGALAAKKLHLRFEMSLHAVLLLTAALTAGILMYVAYEGGKIRHPEAYSQQVNKNVDFELDDD